MKSRFPLSLLAYCVCSALISSEFAQAAVLQPFDPVNNDQQVGVLNVSDGIPVDLTGNQQFQPGTSGGTTTTVGALQAQNRIVNDHGTIGASRLDTGAQNYAITIPDPITGGNTTFQVYNSTNMVELAPIDANQQLTDITDVQDNNYINTRVANVSNGSTLNVNIGQPNVDTSASTNSWLMVAKQSSLFNVDGNSLTPTTLNWNSTNYITFNGAYGTPGAQLAYQVNNLITYNGAFSVQTLDGVVTNFNVTAADGLRSYNDWLIAQLQAGNLATGDYLTEFNKASTRSSNTLDYTISLDDPNDDNAQVIGDRIVINAAGPNARVNLAAGKTLEVSGASGGAVRGSDGALITIDGKLSSEAYNGFEGAALYLTENGRGVNNGVINGNFLNEFNGTGVAVPGFGSNGVQVLNNSQFTNNGIINFAAVGDDNAGINLGSGSTATNNGNINVGVNNNNGSGSNNGVLVGDATAQFINSSGATIYIGRGPQNSLSDTPADTALNMSGGVNGILVNSSGTTINNGNIVIGSGVQNGAGIQVNGVANPNVTNNGTITINGAAAAIPLENIGISVINSGSAGTILNAGTINLNGVNGTGIKVVANDNQSAFASTTGNINILGNTDPVSGTRNFGVWVEGTDGGQAMANISGQFNLAGTGAIGIHARNDATVNLAATTQLTFDQGSDQIGVFAFGPDAAVNISGSRDFDAATTRSTLFRIDSGAQFDSNGLSLIASGNAAKGIVGSGGDGTSVMAQNTVMTVSGVGANGVLIEGGATGSVDAASQIFLTGSNSIGGVADGQKHDLTGAVSGTPVDSTLLTSAASLISSAANAVGYVATNLGQVINNGVINMTGDNNTGLRAQQGGVLTNNSTIVISGQSGTGIDLSQASVGTNNATINVTQGTGINVDGVGTTVERVGNVNVDDGVAGVRLANGAMLALNGGDSTIITNGTAHGILLDTGSAGLTLNNATLNVLGTGNGIENAAETGNIALQNAVINVNNGSGVRTATALDPLSTLQVSVGGTGNGYSFVRADGTPASDNLTLSNSYTFNAYGAGSNGIFANTSGDVSTGATVNITDENGGSTLRVQNAGSVLNTGLLSSVSLVSPVVDLREMPTARFTNTGTIIASSATAQAIATGDGNDSVMLSSGSVLGDVNTGAGDDLVVWNGGTLNGSLTLGGGNNNRADISNVDLSQTSHITSDPGTDNQLNFSGITARGGSFAADDLDRGVNLGNGWNVINFANGTQFELTDNLQLANSNVNIDGTSTLFAGNSVNPTIAGGEPQSVVVTNAGVIDLTNGSGSLGNRLTIDGDLVSLGGSVKLQTTLNEGGPLTNQFTDRLLINGNATSGTTILDVRPTAASVGNLTDINQNSMVDANEGISLVQVGGAASANSFALKGGYVAAGPWRYDLYSFAPGSSDASQRLVAGGTGNNYWDYRLANVYVCENGCTTTPPTQTPPTGTPPTQTPPTGTPPTQTPPAGTTPPAQTPPAAPGQTPVGTTPVPADGTAPQAAPGNSAPVVQPAGRLQVTPQIPSYISAPLGLAYYNAAIVDNLHQRLGELRHEQLLPDGTSPEMFLRYIGSNMSYKTNVGFNQYGYDFDMDYSAVQIGGNLLRLDGEKDSLRGGVAYTYGNSRIKPKAADGASSSTFDNNSLALYLTWQRQNGFYMDGVLSFGNHRGTTDIPRQSEVGSLKAHSWTASLESGYPFVFDNGFKLEPQAQLMFTGINMNNISDKDQTTVNYDNYNQTIGRLGVRADKTWVDDKGRQYSPYVRVNYYKGWGDGAKTTVGSEAVATNYTFTGGKFGQMGELGAGGTVTLKNNLSAYGEVNYRQEISGNGARGWGYTGGLRWTF